VRGKESLRVFKGGPGIGGGRRIDVRSQIGEEEACQTQLIYFAVCGAGGKEAYNPIHLKGGKASRSTNRGKVVQKWDLSPFWVWASSCDPGGFWKRERGGGGGVGGRQTMEDAVLFETIPGRSLLPGKRVRSHKGIRREGSDRRGNERGCWGTPGREGFCEGGKKNKRL